MSGGQCVPAQFYLDDRAGILAYFITGAKAEQVFAEHECDGDVAQGFSYWVSGPGVAKLVHIRVRPVPVEWVPAAVRAELDNGADSVLIPQWETAGFCGLPLDDSPARIGGQG